MIAGIQIFARGCVRSIAVEKKSEINGELRVDGDFTSVSDFEEMLSEYQN